MLMRKYTHLELSIIKAALLINEYESTYNPRDYEEKVGKYEVCKCRHINELIEQIADNSSDFVNIVKSFSDDISYINYEIKEENCTAHLDQMNDAYEIMQLLSTIN